MGRACVSLSLWTSVCRFEHVYSDPVDSCTGLQMYLQKKKKKGNREITDQTSSSYDQRTAGLIPSPLAALWCTEQVQVHIKYCNCTADKYVFLYDII